MRLGCSCRGTVLTWSFCIDEILTDVGMQRNNGAHGKLNNRSNYLTWMLSIVPIAISPGLTIAKLSGKLGVLKLAM